MDLNELFGIIDEIRAIQASIQDMKGELGSQMDQRDAAASNVTKLNLAITAQQGSLDARLAQLKVILNK